MVVLVLLLLVVLLEAVRRQRKEVLVLKYQYRLFALRDELREFAMEDPAIAQNWVFQYLDSTIAKSIKLMPQLSIWFLLGLYLTHRNNIRLEKLREEVEGEYSRPENQKHKQIEEQLLSILEEFIISRHILMLVISVIALALPAALAGAASQLKRRTLELFVESPETSTLYKFAPEHGMVGV